jgi:hypothetical protein
MVAPFELAAKAIFAIKPIRRTEDVTGHSILKRAA